MAKSLRNTTMKVNIEVNSKALDEANRRINTSIHETDKLERSANQSGKAIEQAGRKYANASSSIRKNADSLKENADHARSASREHSSLASSAKRSGDSFREQKRDIDNSSQSLKHFSSAANKVKDTLATIGIGYASVKMFELGKAAIQTGMEFDKQMSAVQAVSGATANQFKELRKQAIDLGASTTKSASEVAEGQLELAKSGFTVKQVMAAMPGVISASTASGENMARTAEVMTAALNSFGLKASEATHVADVLAKAANDSAADINDLGYTFKYAAAPAHMLGISMEELSAATEIMSNAGIKGETAGTSLRAALLRLADPPKAAGNMLDRLGVSITDAHGKMLPFSNIIGQLHDKTKNMANAEKTMALSAIFGTEAVSGMMDVVEAGPTKLNKLTASLKDSDGASKRAADAMSDNLAGAVEQLKGAVESASISVSDTLKPAVKAGVHVVTDLVEGFNDLSPSAKKMVVWGTIVVGGVLPVAYGIYKVRQAVKSLREIMGGAKSFFSTYRSELSKTGQQALITAAEINQVNDAVETTGTTGTSGKKGAKTKYSAGKAASSAAGEVIAQEVAEATSQTTKKSGIVSKIGRRIGKGMAGSKVLPVVGTLLSATQLIGMNNSNAGTKLGGFGGSLAGGAAGAAIGSAIAPGIGTAIGGAAGSIAGSKFGEKFGAAVQKKWPSVVKSIDGFTERHPILSKTISIANPFAGLVLNAHKASKSLKNEFKAPLDSTVRFGKSVNSSTAKAVNSYMNLASKSKVQLNLLAVNGDKYSKSARDSVNKNFSSMSMLVEKSLSKTQKTTKNNLNTLVKNGLLSEKDMKNIENKQKASQKRQLKAVQESSKKMIQINNDAYKRQQDVTKKAEDKINAIKSKAAKEGRTLTKSEKDKIKKIESDAAAKRKKIAQDAQEAISKEEEKQRKNVVASLSKSEKQQKLIMGRLKDASGDISAKQAADVVKQSKKARDGAVKEANKKYKEVVAAADQEYYVNGTITKKQHDDIIKKAKSQRDGAVKHAEDMHTRVVNQAKEQAKGHLDQVDWETGKTLTKWDQHKISLSKIWNSTTGAINKVLRFLHIKTIPEWHPAGSTGQNMPTHATGTPYHPGGPAVVGEEGVELAYVPYKGATLVGQNGAEIVGLPPGTRILPHAQTKQMLNGGLKGQMPGYASGTLGAVQDFVSGAWNKTKDVASAAWDKAKSIGSDIKDVTSAASEWIMHPVQKVKELFDKYLPLKGDIGYGEGLGTSLLKYTSTGIQKYLKDQFSNFAGDWSGGAAAPAQVKQWLLTAMSITGTPASYLGALTKVAMHESGGNPRAINLWDSNAKAGHPSKGLMQTIDSTFNAYKLPGLGDIWNPVANAVAAIRYMNARYGSISNVPGVRSAKYVGYKNGGRKRGNDPVLVGENGPELADLPDGTQIHNTNKTQELLKQKGNITINFAPVINIKTEGNSNDTNESKIQRAVNAALEKAFKDFRAIIGTGVAY
ncbi:phage tail tape measure protein [Heyndrickxia coagulans]|uniref:phage tail tape measure protein n=1 Tax=Heyndrickxia coagulans TaxID=1398 RepID=UPI002E24BABF|nr:phage tail tape measure protein [Heyndrickxia coagulans]MED4933991.1 phage tail tape measure protein [Heyndrickxia coagulans]